MRFVIVFLLITIMSELPVSVVTKRAGDFTRFSLVTQQDFAVKVLHALNVSKVYVYDKTHYFDDAHAGSVLEIRYLTKDNRVAVLSAAAQHVLTNANEYQQFSNTSPHARTEDTVGIYVTV